MSNLQGLCEDCHSDKTGFERLSFVEEECPLTSTFSKEARISSFVYKTGGESSIKVVVNKALRLLIL